MKITIIGGGNIGTQFAVHCAEKKHEIIVFTSKPDEFHKCVQIVDFEGKVTHEGEIHFATNDAAKAFIDRDLIIVTYPANLMNIAAELMEPYVSSNTVICVVPGNGGSECVFRKFIERGNTFFLLERVPAIARLVKKGSIVRSTGYRDELHVAALPNAETDKCAAIIESIFDKKCISIPNILNLTMTPSNPILHTTRMKTIFEDYKPGVFYDRIPLFYEEWNDQSSELLLKCDDEVQRICRALPEFQLNYVKSLKDHYESYTVKQMTNKISNIQAFKGIKTPSVKIGNMYIPDLHSRYFTADFSYGLAVIKQIAEFAGVKTPHIDEVISWYEAVAIEHSSFDYASYGITNKAEFKQFYLN